MSFENLKQPKKILDIEIPSPAAFDKDPNAGVLFRDAVIKKVGELVNSERYKNDRVFAQACEPLFQNLLNLTWDKPFSDADYQTIDAVITDFAAAEAAAPVEGASQPTYKAAAKSVSKRPVVAARRKKTTSPNSLADKRPVVTKSTKTKISKPVEVGSDLDTKKSLETGETANAEQVEKIAVAREAVAEIQEFYQTRVVTIGEGAQIGKWMEIFTDDEVKQYRNYFLRVGRVNKTLNEISEEGKFDDGRLKNATAAVVELIQTHTDFIKPLMEKYTIDGDPPDPLEPPEDDPLEPNQSGIKAYEERASLRNTYFEEREKYAALYEQKSQKSRVGQFLQRSERLTRQFFGMNPRGFTEQKAALDAAKRAYAEKLQTALVERAERQKASGNSARSRLAEIAWDGKGNDEREQFQIELIDKAYLPYFTQRFVIDDAKQRIEAQKNLLSEEKRGLITDLASRLSKHKWKLRVGSMVAAGAVAGVGVATAGAGVGAALLAGGAAGAIRGGRITAGIGGAMAGAGIAHRIGDAYVGRDKDVLIKNERMVREHSYTDLMAQMDAVTDDYYAAYSQLVRSRKNRDRYTIASAVVGGALAGSVTESVAEATAIIDAASPEVLADAPEQPGIPNMDDNAPNQFTSNVERPSVDNYAAGERPVSPEVDLLPYVEGSSVDDQGQTEQETSPEQIVLNNEPASSLAPVSLEVQEASPSSESVEVRVETVGKNDSLWRIMQGRTDMPTPEVFSEIPKDQHDRLMVLVEQELKGNATLIESLGMKVEGNTDRLWLFTGDQFNWTAFNEVVHQVAVDCDLIEDDSVVQPAASEMTTSHAVFAPDSELTFGATESTESLPTTDTSLSFGQSDPVSEVVVSEATDVSTNESVRPQARPDDVTPLPEPEVVAQAVMSIEAATLLSAAQTAGETISAEMQSQLQALSSERAEVLLNEFKERQGDITLQTLLMREAIHARFDALIGNSGQFNADDLLSSDYFESSNGTLNVLDSRFAKDMPEISVLKPLLEGIAKQDMWDTNATVYQMLERGIEAGRIEVAGDVILLKKPTMLGMTEDVLRIEVPAAK